jgi:Lipopolysaccharide-assembly
MIRLMRKKEEKPQKAQKAQKKLISFVPSVPFVAFLLLTLPGCGYRLANKNFNGGRGQSIAVPTFLNRTTTYRIEQRLAEATRQELIRRTHYDVVTSDNADVVVSGEVLNYTQVPVTFDQTGRGSTYAMLVDMKIVVTDTKAHKEIFRNDGFTFREIFQIAQTPGDFVREDPAAMDRLSRHFAASVVDTLMHAKPK